MERWLIVGLGNPGKRYEATRHNVGFMVADALAAKYNLSFEREERHAQLAEGLIANRRVLLAKPQTFMNLSGDAVVPLMQFYKIPAERLMVVCDDIDLNLGTLRLRKEGSSGGQNGLKHIIERLGSPAFARLRFGVGRPSGRQDPTQHVLSPFVGDQLLLAAEVGVQAVKALENWLADGIDLTISRFNGTVIR
jgi:peptidyl-tRNA hydrolase, PTH1 family